jgi:dUTP pyrophosphatase
MNIKFIRLRDDIKLPTRGTKESAGIDIYLPEDIKIPPFNGLLIKSGLSVVIPEDHALIFFNKSSIALKNVIVGTCVIDADYTGEIHIHLINNNNHTIHFNKGIKISQLLCIKTHNNYGIEELFLDNRITERNDGGFGSTGSV